MAETIVQLHVDAAAVVSKIIEGINEAHDELHTIRVEYLPTYQLANWGEIVYAKEGDAGFDLRAVHHVIIEPGEACLVKTGVRMALPAGFELQVRPRSGLALYHTVTVLNAPGTIDAGYRGEIGVILINHGQGRCTMLPGDRIAQAVLAPVSRAKFLTVEQVDEATERGAGGFGSTGHA